MRGCSAEFSSDEQNTCSIYRSYQAAQPVALFPFARVSFRDPGKYIPVDDSSLILAALSMCARNIILERETLNNTKTNSLFN